MSSDDLSLQQFKRYLRDVMAGINKKHYIITYFFILVLSFCIFYTSGCTPNKQTDMVQTSSSATGSPNTTIPSTNATIKQDPWTDIVIKAELIVYGTITDKKYEVETIIVGNDTAKHAYTIYTLKVEKLIKGPPNTRETIIRVPGGIIDDKTYERYIGPNFIITDKALLCLTYKKDDMYIGPEVLWAESTASIGKPIRSLDQEISMVLKIMIDNNIPIMLPQNERPPIPVMNTRTKQ
jgi:hypothetical protein